MRIPKKIEEQRQQQRKQQQKTNTSPFAERIVNIIEKSKTVISNGSHLRAVVDDIVLKAVKAEKSQPRYPVGDDDDDAKKLLETRYQMTDIEFEEFIQALLLENKK
jgi:hypothetical protein